MVAKYPHRGVVVGVWGILFPWIKNQREKYGASLEDFEALYDKWK
jgi:hypothetical protein